jgi:hypothetical protein
MSRPSWCLVPLVVYYAVFAVDTPRTALPAPARPPVLLHLDKRSVRVAEAYSRRCLQYTFHLELAIYRRPGPLSAREADEYLRLLPVTLGSFNPKYSPYTTLPSSNAAKLRQVITVPSTQLCGWIESADPTLAAYATVEAMLRHTQECIPAMTRAAARWQPLSGEGHIHDLPYLLVHGIAIIGGKEARSALERLLRARSPEVRFIAAYELSFTGDRRVIPLLRQAFERSLTPPVIPNRRATKLAVRLIALGDADSRTRAEYLFRKLPVDNRYILPALAERRKPEVLQFLRGIVTDRKQYHGARKWAAIALGRVGDKSSLPYLLRALDDPVRDVAEYALKAIEQIGEPSVVPQLRQIAERFRPRKTLLLVRNYSDLSSPIFFADEILRVAHQLERQRQ